MPHQHPLGPYGALRPAVEEGGKEGYPARLFRPAPWAFGGEGGPRGGAFSVVAPPPRLLEASLTCSVLSLEHQAKMFFASPGFELMG